jgi:small subunit ribosomal protein S16
MVRIRLRRTGKTKQPSYRVVVADSRSPRDGRFIEIIGHYSPTRQPKVLHIKQDRARYWLSVGASPSETVTYLLKKVNIVDDEGNILPESAAVMNGEEEGVGESPPQEGAPVSAEAPQSVEESVDEVAVVEEEAV